MRSHQALSQLIPHFLFSTPCCSVKKRQNGHHGPQQDPHAPWIQGSPTGIYRASTVNSPFLTNSPLGNTLYSKSSAQRSPSRGSQHWDLWIRSPLLQRLPQWSLCCSRTPLLRPRVGWHCSQYRFLSYNIECGRQSSLGSRNGMWNLRVM